MSFIRFSQFGRKNSSFISITASQSFGFGGDFLQENNLLDKLYVELFYDQDVQKIAFRFADAKTDKGAFKLITTKGTNSKSVVARSFFTTFLKGLKMEEYENKYQPEKINHADFGALYAITLKKKNSNN